MEYEYQWEITPELLMGAEKIRKETLTFFPVLPLPGTVLFHALMNTDQESSISNHSIILFRVKILKNKSVLQGLYVKR